MGCHGSKGQEVTVKEACVKPNKGKSPKRLNDYFLGAYRGDLDQVRENMPSNLEKTFEFKKHMELPGFRALRHQLGKYTALHLASEQGHEDVVKFLLDQGADPSTSIVSSGSLKTTMNSLHLACEGGHLHVVQCILAHPNGLRLLESKVERKESKRPLVEDGCTALHLAVQNDFTALVALLLGNGANVNAKTSQGFAPLHWARSASVVSQLCMHGADLQATTQDGHDALHTMRAAGHDEACTALLRSGMEDFYSVTSGHKVHWLDLVPLLPAPLTHAGVRRVVGEYVLDVFRSARATPVAGEKEDERDVRLNKYGSEEGGVDEVGRSEELVKRGILSQKDLDRRRTRRQSKVSASEARAFASKEHLLERAEAKAEEDVEDEKPIAVKKKRGRSANRMKRMTDVNVREALMKAGLQHLLEKQTNSDM